MLYNAYFGIFYAVIIISKRLVILTFGAALITGIFFGIYLAIKAARKDPITSLKHYR